MMENKQQYQGLTSAQVEESRRLHGENVLTPPEKTPLWKQFLEKFEDPIIRILLVRLLSMVIAGVHCWGPEAVVASQPSWSHWVFSLPLCWLVVLAFSLK